MIKIQWRTMNVKWIAILAAVLLVSMFGWHFLLPGEPDLEPQKAIAEVVKNTEQIKSYEYSIRMSTNIDGKEEITSNITGERENEKRIHFKGKIFDSDVDFYMLDSTTYYKDQLTGEWTKMSNNELNQQDIFMQEINPMAGFRYKELNEVKFEGVEKTEGKKYWVYSATPVINNPYMEIMWKDFKYKFWVNPRGLTLNKGIITAVSKTEPKDKLNLTVQFKNLNQGIELVPPK